MLFTQPHEEFQGSHRVILLSWLVRHMRYRHTTHRLCATALISFVCPAVCADTSVLSLRSLYAVNESSRDRGSISVYDINAGHRLIRTIQTIPGVEDIRGVTGNALTGMLYVAYRSSEGIGSVYCLNLNTDTIIWNRVIHAGVDRLAMDPSGRSLSFRRGKVARLTISMSWMLVPAILHERCISPIDPMTLSFRYLDRFSRRRRLTMGAVISYI
jgi:hypothetical protein